MLKHVRDIPANLFEQVFLVSRRFQSVVMGGQCAKLRIVELKPTIHASPTKP
jgi:hypothetical protein